MTILRTFFAICLLFMITVHCDFDRNNLYEEAKRYINEKSNCPMGSLTIAISATPSGPTNISPIPVTINFSETIIYPSDFTDSDIEVSNGSIMNLSTSDSRYYTADVYPAGDGDITVYIPSCRINNSDTDDQYNQASNSLVIKYDTTAPSEPTGLDLDAADDTGFSNTDNITISSSNLTISGMAEPGAYIQLFVDASPTASIDANSSGYWTLDISLSPGATYVLSATATDYVGNTSPYSSTINITVDNTPPLVDYTVPSDGSPLFPVDSTISVTFSEPINPGSISTKTTSDGSCSGTLQVSVDNFSSCIQMLAAPEESDANRTFTVRPSTNLNGSGTTYYLKVTTAVQNSAGLNMDTEKIVIFTTQ